MICKTFEVHLIGRRTTTKQKMVKVRNFLELEKYMIILNLMPVPHFRKVQTFVNHIFFQTWLMVLLEL